MPSAAGDRGDHGNGDRGFREYVTTRSQSLLRTAYLLTGNRADAEDLVQAALAKTYQAWDRIEDRQALDGYVRKAMVNTHISWWRRRRLDEYPTDEIPDRAVADHAPGSDLQDTLRRAIDRLPQRMRAAVVLRYYEDMTEAEVADACWRSDPQAGRRRGSGPRPGVTGRGTDLLAAVAIFRRRAE